VFIIFHPYFDKRAYILLSLTHWCILDTGEFYMTHLYRCLVKFGHAGSGKYVEKPVYVRARDIMEALKRAKRCRGVKKGNLYRTGASVLQISRAS